MLFGRCGSSFAPLNRHRRQTNRSQAASTQLAHRRRKLRETRGIPGRSSSQCLAEDMPYIDRRFSRRCGRKLLPHQHCCRQAQVHAFACLPQKRLRAAPELSSHRRSHQSGPSDLCSRTSEFRQQECCGAFAVHPAHLQLPDHLPVVLRCLRRCPRSRCIEPECGCLH